MVICEIIPALFPLGGAENLVLQLSKELIALNNEVYIISLYDNQNEYISSFLSKNGIKVIYLNKKRGVDFHCAKMLKKALKSIKPDVCHLHLNSYLTFFLTFSFKDYKNHFTFHTFVSKASFGNKNKPINKLLLFMIKKRILYPIAISNSVKTSILDFFNFKDINIPVIMNGIDVNKFQFNNKLDRDFTFITIGRFDDVKNNLFMIKCFAKVKEKYPGITYVICGQGKNFKECLKYCEDNNISNIKFTGFVNNVEDYLSNSSCLLMASLWEGNPLTINEALSCGVWVIANNVGGIPDLINNDKNGYLVNEFDIASFENKMELFIQNKNKCFQKNRNKITQTRNNCSIKRCAFEYCVIFKRGEKNENCNCL